jgi:hypothetical protein
VTRAELIELASPPCHDCGEPVQRVEIQHYTNGPEWQLVASMVCAQGHRVPVEPFDA